MSEEEFKKYVKETLSNINSKITKEEQGFINLLGNTFNDVCAEENELRQENTQLKSVLKEIREYIENNIYYRVADGSRTLNGDNIDDLLEIIDKGIKENE